MDEEIINTLKKIQQKCKEVDECEKCQFANRNGLCVFAEYTPMDWEFNDKQIIKYFTN